jgi:hypothetical protein
MGKYNSTQPGARPIGLQPGVFAGGLSGKRKKYNGPDPAPPAKRSFGRSLGRIINLQR